MPWNLLILPLIAGYFLLTNCNRFKFKQQRLDRQRLIFDSAFFGLMLLLLAISLRYFINLIFPNLISDIYSYSPLQVPFIGISFASLLLSIAISFIGNITVYKNKDKEIMHAIRQIGSELELLLESSFSDSKLLKFTLDTNKFYIGWVIELPIPSITNHIRILPAFSGYRDQQKRLNFTTQYLTVYAEYIRLGNVKEIDELNVDLVLALDKLVSVSYFDIDMYKKFNELYDEKLIGKT